MPSSALFILFILLLVVLRLADNALSVCIKYPKVQFHVLNEQKMKERNRKIEVEKCQITSQSIDCLSQRGMFHSRHSVCVRHYPNMHPTMTPKCTHFALNPICEANELLSSLQVRRMNLLSEPTLYTRCTYGRVHWCCADLQKPWNLCSVSYILCRLI